MGERQILAVQTNKTDGIKSSKYIYLTQLTKAGVLNALLIIIGKNGDHRDQIQSKEKNSKYPNP